MQILTHEQRSAEWYAARSRIFTASEIGDYIAEQKEVRLTIAEITAMLQAQGIELPKKSLKADLVALLPNATELATWTQSTINARNKLIRKKLAQPFYRDARFANLAGAAWLLEIIDREERKIANDPAVQRGIQLEPLARAEYERLTGHEVTEVGLCIHESGGFGCSPDGLIWLDEWSHGVEFKCPLPETFIEWTDIDDTQVPDCHLPQVHMSMAVTGLDRWDFFAFMPGDCPLLVTVHRDEYTERMLAGLLSLVEEMKETKSRHAERWAKINKP